MFTRDTQVQAYDELARLIDEMKLNLPWCDIVYALQAHRWGLWTEQRNRQKEAPFINDPYKP